MSTWSFVYEGFNPDEEGLREALCTLGNGYFATRGASPEAEADDVHYPGTYLAGGYNRLQTDIAGRTIENEDLVNLPNWLPLTFRIDGGEWFHLMTVDVLAYRQELDMRHGILVRAIRFQDKHGRATRLMSRRLVHMGDEHLAALETTLVAENWTGRVEVRTALDGRVVNAGVDRYKGLRNRHLEPLELQEIGQDSVYLKVQTSQSRLQVALAARTRVFREGQCVEVNRRTLTGAGYIGHRFIVDIIEGSELKIEKVVSLFTSQDHAISECGLETHKAIHRAGSFNELVKTHRRAWDHLWRRFDIEFDLAEPEEGDRTSSILHLYLFHVVQTCSPFTMDLDVGVPSRGWHGEAYRGHVFWDELFVFPLLNLRLPEITRALLKYRFRRLDEARLAAQEAGYRGAMYPWQSGSDGREESQEVHLNPKSGRWIPDNSRLQRHVNAAIAYNVFQYYQVSGDMEFLSFYGAEIFLEIARFWASMATFNADIERYEILGVMGPDEYHDGYPDSDKPGLNNNTYTNIMAVWVLCRAREILEILPEDRSQELCETLGVSPEEIEQWEDISRRMRVVFHDDGILSQFEGYGDLEEFDWEGYRQRCGDIQRLDRILEAEGDTPNRYKVSKQADVLMLFYIFSADELRQIFGRLGYPFEYETIPKNVDYYLKRTSHGSTLSRVVHSWVLARSDRTRSWMLFCEALQSDVADIQGGTTPEGIHLGAMAGTVDLVQRSYTDIEPRDDVLWLNPCLPRQLARLHLQIRYRCHTLELEIDSRKMKVSSYRGAKEPIRIGFRGEIFDLHGKGVREFDLESEPVRRSR